MTYERSKFIMSKNDWWLFRESSQRMKQKRANIKKKMKKKTKTKRKNMKWNYKIWCRLRHSNKLAYHRNCEQKWRCKNKLIECFSVFFFLALDGRHSFSKNLSYILSCHNNINNNNTAVVKSNNFFNAMATYSAQSYALLRTNNNSIPFIRI